MKLQSIFDHKNLIVCVIGIVNSIPIIWDYYNGGVPVHHLFHSEDMPGFSNWWGIVTIPVLTWIVITMINSRYKKNDISHSKMSIDSNVSKGFLLSLTFGSIISILWELGFEQILQYLILLPILISLFKPVYLPEYLLGFVLGMVFVFGGVLPIIFGIVLMIICFLVHNVIRIGTKFVISQFK